MILVTAEARAGRFARARRMTRGAILRRRQQNIRRLRALARRRMTRLARAVRLAVREARVLDPARAQHRRRRGEASVHSLQLVAERALRLDHVLGADDGVLARGARRRPCRQDAPHFLGILAREGAVAGVDAADEAVHDPRIAAVRHLGVRIARVEGEPVAALAVGGEGEWLRIELAGLVRHEPMAAGALQHRALPLAVEDVARAGGGRRRGAREGRGELPPPSTQPGEPMAAGALQPLALPLAVEDAARAEVE